MSKLTRFFKGFIDPDGDVFEITKPRTTHADVALDIGYESLEDMILDGYVRVGMDRDRVLVHAQSLKKSLPLIQAVFLPIYERQGEADTLVAEVVDRNGWDVDVYHPKLSTLVLGTEQEIKHGLDSNPKKKRRR